MDMISVLLSNLLAIPILSFLLGITLSLFGLKNLLHPKISSFLTLFLLFSIGLKGGGAFLEHSSPKFFILLASLIIWGLIQPFISYWILRKSTKTDVPTSAAISACFGSVSVMTFAAATSFLEKLQVPYETLVIAILAIMEVPAIISGLFICKAKKESESMPNTNVWMHTLFNKSILLIFLGILVGMVCSYCNIGFLQKGAFFIFKPILCLFLLSMGHVIGRQKRDLQQFSWSLSIFGMYMPLLGGAFGIMVSYFFGLDAGTGTLIAVLTAGASYVAVPAAMKIALPSAKESIYLPLSLGIAFPFNVLVGIPIYYISALKLLR